MWCCVFKILPMINHKQINRFPIIKINKKAIPISLDTLPTRTIIFSDYVIGTKTSFMVLSMALTHFFDHMGLFISLDNFLFNGFFSKKTLGEHYNDDNDN